ncbi:DMT family transporter [Anaerovorax odorimutans]|uniref:DMT family transporter n=1 Tax=Anaerovorax odorimutans TaxID=109327 RepID=A0ABT1RRV2_9FIRM|nr:DMT family transporter [Anaerovorax odorimutans]MCQ4637933.1 DMT family transporter [Anaerovorax odorimutans]
MTKQVKADLMLVVVTLCWGVSYYLMDLSLADLGPFTLNAFRFLGAFVIAGVIAFPKLKTVNKTTMKYSLFVGLVLVTAYIGVTFGVMHTSLSNSGFLCALTVVFTPIMAFFFKKQIPDKKLAVVVVMCLVGIGLLTLNEQLKPALGDILCIMCAVAYAVDLLLTETAVNKEEVDAFQLGVFQLGFTGAFNLILAFITEEPHFPGNGAVWGSVLFLAVFCTGVAFIVQTIAQQYTSASHVGVIFALEPVFAGVVAFFLAGEVLLPRAYAGAVLLIASLFVMEIDFKKICGKKG